MVCVNKSVVNMVTSLHNGGLGKVVNSVFIFSVFLRISINMRTLG